MEASVMDAVSLLQEMEQDPVDWDMLDIDKLLRLADFECQDDGTTLLYYKGDWNARLTFPRQLRTIPVSRLQYVLSVVRQGLTREGML